MTPERKREAEIRRALGPVSGSYATMRCADCGGRRRMDMGRPWACLTADCAFNARQRRKELRMQAGCAVASLVALALVGASLVGCAYALRWFLHWLSG